MAMTVARAVATGLSAQRVPARRIAQVSVVLDLTDRVVLDLTDRVATDPTVRVAIDPSVSAVIDPVQIVGLDPAVSAVDLLELLPSQPPIATPFWLLSRLSSYPLPSSSCAAACLRCALR